MNKEMTVNGKSYTIIKLLGNARLDDEGLAEVGG